MSKIYTAVKTISSTSIQASSVVLMLVSLNACSVTGVKTDTLHSNVSESSAHQEVTSRCNVPGRIRKLGSRFIFLSPSRIIETTTNECNLQSGTVL